jgi:hypothetical protein
MATTINYGDDIIGHSALADPQRNGGAEDVIGIIVPLGSGEPFGIAGPSFSAHGLLRQ